MYKHFRHDQSVLFQTKWCLAEHVSIPAGAARTHRHKGRALFTRELFYISEIRISSKLMHLFEVILRPRDEFLKNQMSWGPAIVDPSFCVKVVSSRGSYMRPCSQ